MKKLIIDLGVREVREGKRRIHLAPTEWIVLKALTNNGIRAASALDIQVMLRLESKQAAKVNTVTQYITRLRRKLGPESIRTLYGFGYRLERRFEKVQ